MGSLTSHSYFYNKDCETGPPFYSPYPRRLESLIICWCNYKISTFYSVILRPWLLVWPELNSRPPAWQPYAQQTEPPVCTSYRYGIKNFALRHTLKERLMGTQKWSIKVPYAQNIVFVKTNLCTCLKHVAAIFSFFQQILPFYTVGCKTWEKTNHCLFTTESEGEKVYYWFDVTNWFTWR